MFDAEIAALYTSPSQRIRVQSEHWVHTHLYCPNCGARPLQRMPNNSRTADFECARCHEMYELKSKRGPFGRKVVDGAYAAMVTRLSSPSSPSLLLLSYGGQAPEPEQLVAVPRDFLIPALIEKRPALSRHARRAGWVGCNILLDGIPLAGRVTLFADGSFRPDDRVIREWSQTRFLRQADLTDQRGWLVLVMKAIQDIGTPVFTLQQVYALEDRFKAAFPHNDNIRAKVRQQLQRLRDAGYLRFMGGGVYSLVGP